MGEDVARAVGAGDFVTVDGTDYYLSPLDMGILSVLQRQAVKYYKRLYLESYRDGLEILESNGNSNSLLQSKLEEISSWDIDKCPTRRVHDTSAVKITSQLKKKLEELMGEIPSGDDRIRALLRYCLDAEKLNAEDVEKLTDSEVGTRIVEYDLWWISGTYDGMITMVWTSVNQNHPELTKEQVSRWPIATVASAQRTAERMTSPDPKNTSDSPPSKRSSQRKSRKRRPAAG